MNLLDGMKSAELLSEMYIGWGSFNYKEFIPFNFLKKEAVYAAGDCCIYGK